MKDYQLEHELMRRKVWCDTWSKTASASDCKRPSVATEFADAALSAFDDRFARIEEKVELPQSFLRGDYNDK